MRDPPGHQVFLGNGGGNDLTHQASTIPSGPHDLELASYLGNNAIVFSTPTMGCVRCSQLLLPQSTKQGGENTPGGVAHEKGREHQQ